MLVHRPTVRTLRQSAARIALLSSCAISALTAQTAARKEPPAPELGVDATIKPGDDFFAYANGAWLKAAHIPDGKQRWGARDDINALTRQRLAQLLDVAGSAKPGTSARKVADFRAAWLDATAIEAHGAAPVKPELDSIEAIADEASLTRQLGRGMRADVDPLNWGVYESSALFGLSVEPSIHGERTYTPFLLQGGLGLPDRDQYLSDDARSRTLRATYRDYIAGLLAFAGVAREKTEQRADAVLALETAIARVHATPAQSGVDHNADNVWTHADFIRRAPGIDWHIFFASAGLGTQDSIVAWQPASITGVAALIASEPLEAWKDYLRFHAIDQIADVLPRKIADAALALRAEARPVQSSPAPRAERAIDAANAAMSDAVGRMYAERFFPQAQKARLQRVVANIKAAFVARVEKDPWMSPGMRSTALAKLNVLYIGMGYPEQWQDYSDLVIDPRDAAGNIRRVADRNYRRAISRLGKPVDMKEWWIAPHTINAILVFQQNAYEFSAALLQTPKYDPAMSDAQTYGAIGAIVGHDVSHFVDALGAEYQVDGSMRRWWTPEDSSRFQSLADPLDAQFAGYRPFPDAAVNGALTQSENIADLAGLSAAFDAYRKSLGARANDKRYVRQNDREFFIAFAQSWRTKMSDAAIRAQLANDHAPEMYRISTVRNLDAWYEAFDVLPGQRLYLEPKARVRVW